MKLATVIGALQAKCTAAGYENVNWVQVRTENETVVAADVVGAKAGQPVLLLTGDAAGRYRMDLCSDALVVAVLEETGNNG